MWVRYLPNVGPTLLDDPTLYMVASSSSLSSPFTVKNANVSMYWSNSADDNLFVDEDGTGYIVHTARSSNTTITVETLSVDYYSCLGWNDSRYRSEQIGPGHTEAPALARLRVKASSTENQVHVNHHQLQNDHNHHEQQILHETHAGHVQPDEYIYVLTFAPLCCFCVEGSTTLVYSAKHPLGPYTVWGAPLGNAPAAQQNFLFTHPKLQNGSEILWAGNRWGSDPVHNPPHFDNSLMYWTPLTLKSPGGQDGFNEIKFQDSVVLSVDV